MKVLISFYSRTGVTRRAAKDIREMLLRSDVDCKIEDILDKKNRDGKIGYMAAGKDALMGKETDIGKIKNDPADFDLVVLGTPVWAGNMTPALRTYIKRYKGDLSAAAFLCTHGGGGESKTFKEVEKVAGVPPTETISLKDKDVRAKKHLHELEQFVERLQE
ncbi:MAG: NAD(P)H-dependent oxidoreductase [Thermoplasmata archaeon]